MGRENSEYHSVVMLPKSKAEERKYAPKINVSGDDPKCIVAVAVNRHRQVGLATIDIAAPYELILSDIADSHNFVDSISLIKLYNPVEILVVDSKQPHPLIKKLNLVFSESATRVVPVARQYFDQTKGAQDLKRIAANCIDTSIVKKYMVMAALSCTLKYVEFVQGIYVAEKSVHVHERGARGRLWMDSSTIAALELVFSSRSHSSTQSLFGIINNCQTAVGSRLLRSTLMNPSGHLATINARLELVQVFLENPSCFFTVLEILGNFGDLDKIMGQLVVVPKVITPRVAKSSISRLLGLKSSIYYLQRLSRRLVEFKTDLGISSALYDSILKSTCHEAFVRVQQIINETISEDATSSKFAEKARHHECFAVKAGIDGFLDLARQNYLDTVDSIEELVEHYMTEFGVEIKLRYSAKRGYHLKYSTDIPEIPNVIIDRVRLSKSSIACTTKALKGLDARAQTQLINIYTLSNQAIQASLAAIRPYLTPLYSMVESIAMLDMILSFANFVAINSAEHPFVRPTLMATGNLVIQECRHALVEQFLSDEIFVRNNVYCDPQMNLQLITGPNCAGKSTYLRMIAICVILAQSGCFVPATQAFIPIRDRIFTRIGTSDDMESNSSSFMVEMEETAYMLENQSAQSLILVDELCRGTCHEEGFPLAWAVCEELSKKGAYVFFATHFHELSALTKSYTNIKTFHFNSSYKISAGPCPKLTGYGISLAQVCGIPQRIIAEAVALSKEIQLPESKSNQALLKILSELQQLNLSDLAYRRQLQLLRQSLQVEEPKEDLCLVSDSKN